MAGIGNAASAIQFIPRIAPEVAGLTVFQSSANYVVPRMDRAYTAAERAAFGGDEAAFAASRAAMYAEREERFARMRVGSAEAAELTRIAREHLDAHVIDPALREHLWPDYPIGCKRILISDDYFPALNRANVTVITSAIARIVPEGIVTADGALHEADVIIHATGFETRSFHGPVTITGVGGQTLAEAWNGTPRALHGITVPGFPNFFMLYGPNTNLGHNSILEMLEAQSRYVIQAQALLDNTGALNAKPAAPAAFDGKTQAAMVGSAWAAGCTSWYARGDGRVINNWSGTVGEYRAAVAGFDPADYDLLPPPPSPYD